ncbi:MAG TPA: YdcF family protein, partial [Vicinamibacterales bacterium]|nr:YdcF family protein [Vicinamibacterales bacterium]
IVVFAGGVGENGRAGGGMPERLNEAVALYRAGYAPYMIFSSGYVYSFKEAESMRDLAVAQGVSPSAIVLEQRATNTHQNVVFSNAILRDHKSTSILLVSSPYHMRRALMVWHKLAPDITVTPTPPPRSQFYDHSRGATFEQVRSILYEYLAILGYWRRGWI